MKIVIASLTSLVFVSAAGMALAQQQAAPAPPNSGNAQHSGNAQQPAPKPALKLRLNEIDDGQRRAIINFQPRQTTEAPADAASNLPGLGGKPKTAWGEASPEDIVPKSSNVAY